ncbi:MAG: NHL repeat-containing protein [Polyangiales bacterium]
MAKPRFLAMAVVGAFFFSSGCSNDQPVEEAQDTGADTTPGVDSGAPLDTASDDSSTTDSTSDTTVADTSVADTSVADTASSDGETGGTTAWLSGKVETGTKAVAGSKVTAYAAGDGTTAAKALACVTTDSGGNFQFGTTAASVACAGSTLPTDFKCPATGCPAADAQIYLVANGGNPGLAAGTDNDALALLAVLGRYGDLATSTTVDVSPLTTVAATYPLGPMMDAATATKISFKSPWLQNAVARARSLVSVATSKVGTGLPDPASCTGDFTDPVNCFAETKLSSLANTLAACANTVGSTSTSCKRLLCDATPGATFSTTCSITAAPKDTLQAALSIARNPGRVAIADLYTVGSASSPYAPSLTAAPNDWTLALAYTTGGLNHPMAVAVDGKGQVWVTNGTGNSVTVLSPLGDPISGSPFSGGGLNFPASIAFDATGKAWLGNLNGKTVTALDATGAVVTGSPFSGGGLDGPQGVAIDASGHVWVTNFNAHSVTELSSAGAALSPASGFTGGGLKGPAGIAISGTGKIWVANNGTGAGDSSVSELDATGTLLSPSTGFLGAGIDHALGIALDATGNVWVASANNDRVIKFDGTGALLSPSTGYTGGGLSNPHGLAIDGAGRVWVSNTFKKCVTELDTTGAALSPSTGFTATRLEPDSIGLAIDSSGNVWVVDYGETTDKSAVTVLVGAATPVKTPMLGPPASP